MEEEKFYYDKELRWLKASEITVVEDYRIYAPREREDLLITLREKGILEPMTVVLENGQYILLNGFDRLSIVLKEKEEVENEQVKNEDIMVPAWVILVPLSDAEKKSLILDLARVKKKTYVDNMAEFHLYNQLIPNDQGKKMGGKNRFKIIAKKMGISTSQLSKLLRIDKIKPTLLSVVDHEHLTLDQAEQRAKIIKRNGRNRDARNTHAGMFSPGKEVNLNNNSPFCPSCNRPFDDLDWKDIPNLFTFKRDETNNQTEWLEELTADDIDELNKGGSADTGNHEDDNSNDESTDNTSNENDDNE